jgi:hypothetical protein
MLLGVMHALSHVFDRVRFGFEDTIILTVVMVAFRALTGRMWVAMLLTLAFFTVLIGRENDGPLLLNLIVSAILASFGVIALARFGVLTCTTATFTNSLLLQAPLTVDSAKVYAPIALTILALLAGVALTSAYFARGHGPLLRRISAG